MKSSIGTHYGDEVSFITSASIPTVTTNPITNITANSATGAGNVTSSGGATVTARGIAYGTSEYPTISGSTVAAGNGTGSFTANITGLQPGTTYYVRAYATNSAGTAYGEQVSFTTGAVIPTVTTNTISNITSNSATGGGNVLSSGGAAVTARGIAYGTSQNPTIAGSTVAAGSGTGSFTANMAGLQPGTTYYVRAYATNSDGTAYGEQVSFTTLTTPTVTTNAISNITSNIATGGGNVTSSGGAAVTARGIAYGTSQNPTIAGSTVAAGSGTGSFTAIMTGLQPGTTYYVRAYATNIAGTAYGEQVSFTTGAVIPTVTTNPITNITPNSATGGGNVTSTGGAAVTARGIAYGTSQNPTIGGSTVAAGSGTGSFTANMTGLQIGTTYYVRAYATNSAGTAYGEQVSFTIAISPCHGITPPSGYGVVESSGKCWLDRNLGATRVAQNSTDAQAYGDLYQWGRRTDGHEKRTSGTTMNISSSNTPGHGNFILAPNSPRDWRSPQNDNLWQGLNGINNPCPTGFRLPTQAEWSYERAGWSSTTSSGAFESPLKLPAAGSRDSNNGSLRSVGYGYYWSSTVSGTFSCHLLFFDSPTSEGCLIRAFGLSVRCIKD